MVGGVTCEQRCGTCCEPSASCSQVAEDHDVPDSHMKSAAQDRQHIQVVVGHNTGQDTLSEQAVAHTLAVCVAVALEEP